MKVLAEHFHPMRGHVMDGVVVMMPNNSELVVKNTIKGWVLVDSDGKQVYGPVAGAYELTAQIVNMMETCCA